MAKAEQQQDGAAPEAEVSEVSLLDQLVEESAGLQLGSLFEIHGEEVYRRHQREALESWLKQHGSGVLAPGVITGHDDVISKPLGDSRY